MANPLPRPRRIIYLYWGRRGMSQFASQLADAAADEGSWWRLSLSRQNEEYSRFAGHRSCLLPVDTFAGDVGALTRPDRLLAARRMLAGAIRNGEAETVVNLMPHVWSPFVIPAVHAAGARYVSVLHDARRHPGDRTGLAHRLLLLDARRADHVVTLSRAVTELAVARCGIAADKITTLFHPRLTFGVPAPAPPPGPGEPFRLLFLGRIMAYKGLPVLVEAMEKLRASGLPLHLSVMGQGELAPLSSRLAALGATVDNRWLDGPEIAAALRACHAVVLSHVEASQSGVAAAALGAGVPVVAMPSGGLREQVVEGETGVFASRPNADDLAEAIRRLAGDPALHLRLVRGIAGSAGPQSMAAFVRHLGQVA